MGSTTLSARHKSPTAAYPVADSPILPLTKEFWTRVLYRFDAWRGTPEEAEIVPSQATSNSQQTSQRRQTKPQNRHRKREATQDLNAENGQNGTRASATKRRKVGIRKFACPFWKRDPAVHRHCFHGSTRIRDVKQHLTRNHLPPPHCRRCGLVFEDEDDLDAHILQAQRCEVSHHVQFDGITRSQRKELSNYSDRRARPEDQWFKIWDILFPGTRRPSNPYVDEGISEEMSSFHQFWASEGLDLLYEVLHPSVSQQALRANLEEGFESVYGRWLQRRAQGVMTLSSPGGSSQSSTPSTDDTPSPPNQMMSTSSFSQQFSIPWVPNNFQLLPLNEESSPTQLYESMNDFDGTPFMYDGTNFGL